MRIAVVGKGGREAAISWKLAKSSAVSEIVVYPGNAGIEGKKIRTADFTSTEDLIKKIEGEKFDYVVVGQEKYLEEGLIDTLILKGIPSVGPIKAASKLESSKLFCKQIFQQADVPTAAYQHFTNKSDLEKFTLNEIESRSFVVKWDYLAEGKGVFVCTNQLEVKFAIEQIDTLAKSQGVYSVLVEDCLEGKEFSAFCLVDNNIVKYFSSACDYKRLNANPGSPNTGGMGTYSPADVLNVGEEDLITKYSIQIISALKNQGISYNGVLFLGCMQVEDITFLLEVNTRFGDPETQSILPRLKSDLAVILQKMSYRGGRLHEATMEWSDEVALHVVKADANYPTGKKNNVEIHTKNSSDAMVFYAGVENKGDRLYTNGGRVLGITAVGKTKKEARRRAYDNLMVASFEGEVFREDIGC